MLTNETAGQEVVNRSLKCNGCGALLYFAPGTKNLKCDHCGESNAIETTNDDHRIVSVDLETFLAGIDENKINNGNKVVNCSNCGSQTILSAFVTSDKCSFCTAPLVLTPQEGQQYLPPHYILPFAITQREGIGYFEKWLKGLWWAPSDLTKKVSGSSSPLNGIYLPHWTYDTDTITDYTGERGDYYYTTETYTEEVDGKTVTRTRQVRHTAWSYASGTVHCSFEDLIVPASKSLPGETLVKLEPWAFDQLVKFDERYMSGFRSETYQLSPQDGFDMAKLQTESTIHSAIRNDIGGDEQQIDKTDTTYTNNGIKYLMLPVWVSAYNYNNKIYQFTINASTGEVIGQRPISYIKIALFVLMCLAIIAAIILVVQNQ